MRTTAKPMRFRNDEDREFSRDLKARISAYFAAEGVSRYATPAMWAKAAFYILGYWATWTYLVFGGASPAAAYGLWLLLGFFGVGNALNVAHDASHYTFTRARWPNRALLWLSMNQLGFFAHYWDIGHNVTHHSRANISGQDVAFFGGGIFRYTESDEWKPAHRYQAWYAFPLYAVYTMLWAFIRDFGAYRKGDLNGILDVGKSRAQLAELVFVKLFYFGYMLAIPLAFSPYSAAQVIGGFVGMHALLSIYVAIVLFSSHMNEAVSSYDGTRAELPHSFVRHQFLTTCDFYPASRVANFFLGGFNAHVLHHLAPTVSSVHYPALASALEETARAHRLPYLRSTLPKLLVSHVRYLHRLGRDPSATSGRKKTPTRFRVGVAKKSASRRNVRRKAG